MQVGRDTAHWTEGHAVFDAARRRYLDETRRAGITATAAVLNFAELVAKVIYNETGPRGGFDPDSAWYIGPVAVLLVRAADDPALTSAVRAALGDWPSPEFAAVTRRM